MSNKTQLQTNNAKYASLIEILRGKATGGSGEDVTEETTAYTTKIGELETAVAALESELEGKASGSSGGSFITNKLNGATIDATSIGPGATEILHTYVTSKPITAYIMGNWEANMPLTSAISDVSALVNNTLRIAQSDDDSVDMSLSVGYGSYLNSSSTSTRYIIMMSEDADVELDYFSINHNLYACYVKDTKILLADGTTKFVQDITYDDILFVWDFDNGCYASAKPLWIKKPEIATYYYHCIFENGIELDLVGSDGNCHAIYCLDDNRFEYANNCVGKMVVTNKGTSSLLSCERVDEEVEFYNIITDYHINCYANDVLTSTKLNNIYPMENMRFIKEDREIIQYEKFSGVPLEFYTGLRLGENKAENIDRIIENVKIKLSKMLIINKEELKNAKL